MIFVELECDATDCDASETVDVYFNDMENGSEVRSYAPEGWQLVRCDVSGYALALCPEHRCRGTWFPIDGKLTNVCGCGACA
ncbi:MULTISPECIES: hypothetical protein [Mycobacteriaceae]|uniref:hypothetical protein n=1 Tax=Mycobacteriaceae TaxID=1762 RepID=UPI000991D56B|nr:MULTISPECIES: hypothetical protein [Mycobacteriaceae]MDO3058496.1 hypothetical protein [Mycobacteroides abscessus subsp. abscessus]MDO3277968.1 hypothetical protein [Mycobacteroides abscessus subsp. abscessus]